MDFQSTWKGNKSKIGSPCTSLLHFYVWPDVKVYISITGLSEHHIKPT